MKKIGFSIYLTVCILFLFACRSSVRPELFLFGPTSGFVGESFTLELTYQPRNLKIENLTWESTNLNVATVDFQGMVVLVGQGDVIILVRMGSLSASWVINVKL